MRVETSKDDGHLVHNSEEKLENSTMRSPPDKQRTLRVALRTLAGAALVLSSIPTACHAQGTEKTRPGSGVVGSGGVGSPRKILRVEQITRGIPGRGNPRRGSSADGSKSAGGEVFQTLWLDADNGRIRLEEYASSERKRPTSVLIVRTAKDTAAGDTGEKADARSLAGETVSWELLDGGKKYKEHRGDLRDYQKKRRIHETEMLRKIATYSPAERQRALEGLHLRADGSRVVFVDDTPTAPRLGHACRRLQVTENGRQILDADLAESIDAGGVEGSGGRYFALYRRLGVFSDEVLEKLTEVRGVPLRAEITMVTELSPRTFHVEVTKVEERAAEKGLFTLPEGAEKIPDIPPITKCPHCGRKFETKKGSRIFTPGGTVYVCGQKCFIAVKNATSGRRPRPRRPAPPPPSGTPDGSSKGNR